MNQPGLNDAQPSAEDTTNAKRMLFLFGALTLVFVCGGSAVTGFAGYGSESDGVTAAMIATGPGCCSLAGLLTAGLALLAFKTKPTAQLIAPIVAGLFGGLFGAVSIFVFFEAIWPSL